MARKDDYPTFRTPAGKLRYPFLQEARDYKSDGKFAYSTELLLDGEDAAMLTKFIDEQLEEAQRKFKTKKIAHTPYDDAVDENGDEIDPSGLSSSFCHDEAR